MKKIYLAIIVLIGLYFIPFNIAVAEGNTADITIKNTQNDSGTNTYTYSIKLNGVSGLVYYTIDGTEHYEVFKATGTASITIEPNQTLVLRDIPLNTSYTIEQNKIGGSYKTLVNGSETTMAQGVTGSDTTISFDNVTTTVKSNPVTADSISTIALILLSTIITLAALKNTKIKRYE